MAQQPIGAAENGAVNGARMAQIASSRLGSLDGSIHRKLRLGNASRRSEISSPLLLSIGIRDRQTLSWIQVKAPFLLSLAMQPIREAKLAASAEQMRRLSEIEAEGSGVSEGMDYGPSIRQRAICDHQNQLLRDVDIEIAEAADPDKPNRLIRRARRLDPLARMKGARAISQAQYDAGEWLRNDLERSQVAAPEGTVQECVRSAPWSRHGYSEAQSLAMARVRRAIACVEPGHREALTWILYGGSIGGFAKLRRCHHQRVSDNLRTALQSLAVHYGLCRPGDGAPHNGQVDTDGEQ